MIRLLGMPAMDEAIPFASVAPVQHASPCSECGVLPPEGQSFDTIGGSAKSICTLCQSHRTERQTLAIMALVAACVVFALIRCARDPKDHWLFINLVLVALLTPLSVALHELGHVLGAWLMRCQVFGVRLGRGSRLVHFETRGIEVRIGVLPIGGAVTVAPRSPRWLRPRMAFMVFMAPAVNLALIALGIWKIAPADHWLLEPWWSGFAPWHALIYANTVIALASLLPTPRLSSTQGPSDGNLIIHYLLGPRERLEARCFDRIVMEADRLQSHHRFDEASALLENALRNSPGPDARVRLTHLLGVVRLGERRHLEGIHLLSTALDATKPQPTNRVFRGMTLNNLAWGHLIIGGAEHLVEADRRSSAAYAMLPDHAGTRSTRGSVLVEKGEIDQGLTLLRIAMKAAERDQSKACCASFIAIGEQRAGNETVARAMLAEARRLDPHCEVLARAEREFSA
jgi:hypothetical protein